jgi:hypothetical protein
MDFSGNGQLDLPATTAESLSTGDPRVLAWLKEAIAEGERINRADPSYSVIERAQQYIVGEQLGEEQRRLKYLPQIVVNETRKAMQAHVSALTDLQPTFGWKATNPAYALASDMLNKLAVAEWITQMQDIELGEVIKYSLAGGTGDLVLDWDPHVPLGGANQFSPRDPRDTLPIRPSNTCSPQFWQGVVLREEHTVNALAAMYPSRASMFRPSSDNTLGTVMGKMRTLASRLLTPSDPLDALGQSGIHSRQARSGSVVTYRAFLKDHTRNLTQKPILMGTPGTAWSYLAQPKEPLYPRGRLIVFTDDFQLYDGPNPYWHGMFPIARLKLWSVPWQFLGIPLFNDLLPVQDAINETLHDTRLAMRQWVDPDVVYNRNAISESTMRTFDPRRPGKRIKTMPGFGEPYKKQEGPNAQVIGMMLTLWEQLTTKFSDLSGTANLTQLLQLRQLPSDDTIEKFHEALTPEIRSEARNVEAFLRDLAEIIKVNYFQFLPNAKRVAILGDGGEALQDFDYDPGTLVPSLKPGDQGYVPELDGDLTSRDERARFFHKSFVFVVAPNSVLALNAQENKLMRLQLARMGYYDFWSLHETLGTPNVGAPPAIPLPPLNPIPPEQIQQLLAQAQADPAFAAQLAQKYTIDPVSGQVMEIRIPVSITERLIAQAQLGIGMTESPAGRKASGQEPPKQQEKSDGKGGKRTTVTESK